MCGIFGIIGVGTLDGAHVATLTTHARQRGRDSSGLVYFDRHQYRVERADYDIKRLLKDRRRAFSDVVLGHSRLITNGLTDNQPVMRDGVFVLHNGIIVNHEETWPNLKVKRSFEIDSEIIAALAVEHFDGGGAVSDLPALILATCKGTVACAIGLPKLGKLLLFSNNGSLYAGHLGTMRAFSSERYPLEVLGCTEIVQVRRDAVILDIPTAEQLEVYDARRRSENLIPTFKNITGEEAMLKYERHDLQRCTRCVLPSTMPYIAFDPTGVCNYCRAYTPRNQPKPVEELVRLLAPYRRAGGPECIVPFSGGRDSCFGLHLIVNELGLRPITYTYDWGMVTDLGRRNISRMCAELGVENIIVADDISAKRRNIALNLKAWLRAPDLGMVSIFTAGDKHFFRHVETVKQQTGVSLNLWGINPLEVTHFKAGFLGVAPDFEEKRVYMHGVSKQLHYQWLRLRAMLKSPGYFNRSLWDTLSGEYYRSFTEKSDYFHIFDYWRWDERVIDETLARYEWELAPDTNTTWRIGDGTAAFYNYIYYTVAGFTEHDTFRSNQVREGQMTREEAITRVEDENRPRYQNLRWYLDALGMDFKEVISVINRIPKVAPVAGAVWPESQAMGG
jgi:glucosamine--fructose-6-phosphate aminotransferase (isomerizing)